MRKNLIIVIKCPFCGERHEVKVSEAAYNNWCGGELIQRAMPDLTPTQREQLVSGLCPSCQKGIFGY